MLYTTYYAIIGIMVHDPDPKSTYSRRAALRITFIIPKNKGGHPRDGTIEQEARN